MNQTGGKTAITAMEATCNTTVLYADARCRRFNMVQVSLRLHPARVVLDPGAGICGQGHPELVAIQQVPGRSFDAAGRSCRQVGAVVHDKRPTRLGSPPRQALSWNPTTQSAGSRPVGTSGRMTKPVVRAESRYVWNGRACLHWAGSTPARPSPTTRRVSLSPAGNRRGSALPAERPVRGLPRHARSRFFGSPLAPAHRSRIDACRRTSLWRAVRRCEGGSSRDNAAIQPVKPRWPLPHQASGHGSTGTHRGSAPTTHAAIGPLKPRRKLPRQHSGHPCCETQVSTAHWPPIERTPQ